MTYLRFGYLILLAFLLGLLVLLAFALGFWLGYRIGSQRDRPPSGATLPQNFEVKL